MPVTSYVMGSWLCLAQRIDHYKQPHLNILNLKITKRNFFHIMFPKT